MREFMPPARAAAPVLSKAHSSRRSAGKAGAAVGNSKRGEAGRYWIARVGVVVMGMRVRRCDGGGGGGEDGSG